MKLSLSVRIAEAFDTKRYSTASISELITICEANGYAALCMRASQIGIHTQIDEVLHTRKALDTAGLSVSMVTGDFPIPENHDEHGPQALRAIEPYLDLAEALGSDLLRICMKSEDDIQHAQRAADQAAERGLRLAHQCHTRSLFEKIDVALKVLKEVNRPNFGIIYEPANLDHCGQDYGPETIRRLAPHIFNVYLQNHRIHKRGTELMPTWCRGLVKFDHIALWDPQGLPFNSILNVLSENGYDGYVTVHQAFKSLAGPAEAASKSANYLRSLIHFA